MEYNSNDYNVEDFNHEGLKFEYDDKAKIRAVHVLKQGLEGVLDLEKPDVMKLLIACAFQMNFFYKGASKRNFIISGIDGMETYSIDLLAQALKLGTLKENEDFAKSNNPLHRKGLMADVHLEIKGDGNGYSYKEDMQDKITITKVARIFAGEFRQFVKDQKRDFKPKFSRFANENLKREFCFTNVFYALSDEEKKDEDLVKNIREMLKKFDSFLKKLAKKSNREVNMRFCEDFDRKMSEEGIEVD